MKLSNKLIIVNIFFVVAIVWSMINYLALPSNHTMIVLVIVLIASSLGNVAALIRGPRRG